MHKAEVMFDPFYLSNVRVGKAHSTYYFIVILLWMKTVRPREVTTHGRSHNSLMVSLKLKANYSHDTLLPLRNVIQPNQHHMYVYEV